MKARHSAPKRPRHTWIVVGAALALLAGAAALAYPTVAKWATTRAQQQDLMDYTVKLTEVPSARFQRAVDANEIRDFNSALSELSVPNTEVIGQVQLPSVGISLPIYPDSSDWNLKRGAGHLEGTGLPVGGAGTHAAITAHSGMVTARMFDGLERVGRGDHIVLSVLDHELWYKVNRIIVDTPEDGHKQLQPQTGKDLVTLVTCTPYGVNTHRLLVTGERVDSPQSASGQSSPREEVDTQFPFKLAVWGAGLSVLLGATGLVTLMRFR